MSVFASEQNHYQNVKLIRTIKYYCIGFFVIAFFVQTIISADLENVVCAALASVTSIISFSYIINVRRFANWPFSMIMLLGYSLGTLSGTLFAQTIGWRALTYNLDVPVQSFLLMAFIQFLVLGCHAFYVRVAGMRAMRRIVSRAYQSWGLFIAPRNYQLWVLGGIGSLALWITIIGQYGSAHFGEIWFKFLNGFTHFVVAPFLIPISANLFGASRDRSFYSVKMLFCYFVFLCFTAMGTNTRVTFAVSIFVFLIALFMGFFLGEFVVKRKHLLIIGMLIIPSWFGISVLSDFATAMVLVRGERANVSAKELIDQTWNVFQDKEALIKFRNYEDTINAGYNEVYIDNVFLSRFVFTKYIDLNLSLAEQLDEQGVARAKDQFVKKFIANFPTPLMNAIDSSLDKEDLQYSSGDFYNKEIRGEKNLGGYRTGSVLVDGFVVLGWFYIPVLVCVLFVKFILFDALSIRARDGRTTLSAMGILFIYSIFSYGGVMDESLAGQLGGIIRNFPQAIFLYLLAFHGSRFFVITSPRKNESLSKNDSSAM